MLKNAYSDEFFLFRLLLLLLFWLYFHSSINQFMHININQINDTEQTKPIRERTAAPFWLKKNKNRYIGQVF